MIPGITYPFDVLRELARQIKRDPCFILGSATALVLMKIDGLCEINSVTGLPDKIADEEVIYIEYIPFGSTGYTDKKTARHFLDQLMKNKIQLPADFGKEVLFKFNNIDFMSLSDPTQTNKGM